MRTNKSGKKLFYTIWYTGVDGIQQQTGWIIHYY